MPARLRQPDPELSWSTFWEAFDESDPPARARASVIAGKLLRDLGDFKAAEHAFRRATSSGDPQIAADGWNLLGELLRRANDYSGSAQAYQNAINAGVHRTANKAAYNRGLLLWQEDDPEAEQVFRAAMSEDDPDVPAWATVTLGDWLLEHERPDEAQAAYRAAIELDHPGASPKALLALASLQSNRGQTKEAEDLLRRATQAPEGADAQLAWFQLGQLQAQRGDVQAALESLETCARGPDDGLSATTALVRAQLLASRGYESDRPAVRKLFDKAASNGPPDVAASASHQLAVVALADDQYLDALLWLALSIGTSPSAAAFVDLALLTRHHSSPMTEQSLQVIAESPDESLKSWALRSLGDLRASKGADAAATDAYRAAFELKADQSDLAGAALAVQLADEGEPAEAQEIADTLNGWETWSPLERALLNYRLGTADDGELRSRLDDSQVFALGTSQPDAEESDLLHFTTDEDDGQESVHLPLFTRIAIVHDAVIRNPGWLQLSVLGIEGGALMKNIDDDVTAVLNPWTALEASLTKHRNPAHRRAELAE